MNRFALLTLLALSSLTAAEEPPASIQVLMDDSGVLMEAAEAQHYKLLLLSQLKGLASRRNTARTVIDVISTSRGRTVWSGTPMMLRREPEAALALVEAITASEDRCNNLPGAFAELRSNLLQLERSGTPAVTVLVFSSLIHTPRPCGETTRITLPQLPPQEGDINGALAASRITTSVSFYWVSPHQRRVWEEFLSPAIAFAGLNGSGFNLFDVERSKRELRTRLSLLEVTR